jgi:hypothetical protein
MLSEPQTPNPNKPAGAIVEASDLNCISVFDAIEKQVQA